jgi:hypothetical protein
LKVMLLALLFQFVLQVQKCLLCHKNDSMSSRC